MLLGAIVEMIAFTTVSEIASHQIDEIEPCQKSQLNANCNRRAKIADKRQVPGARSFAVSSRILVVMTGIDVVDVGMFTQDGSELSRKSASNPLLNVPTTIVPIIFRVILIRSFYPYIVRGSPGSMRVDLGNAVGGKGVLCHQPF